MNPMIIQGLSLANQLRGALSNNKKKAKRTVYDELRDSSANISDLRRYLELLDSDEKLDVGGKEAAKRRKARAAAGPVTQAAHVRLNNRKNRLARRRAAVDAFDFDKAKDQLLDGAEEAKKTVSKKLKPWKKKAKKQSRKIEKAAEKARKRAEKKARAKQRRQQRRKVGKNLGIVAAVLAALSAVAAAVYWFFFRQQGQAPATRPPHVEEHAGKKEATLVHTSRSEDDLEAEPAEAEPREKLASELAAEPAERDEELLGSIDEQLAAHRQNEDAVAEASEGAQNASDQLDEETRRAEEIFKRYREDQTDNQDK
ncbi:hypothetical protein C3B44_00115 [Corynebacterium yudongzhengii]|uniref:Uncharacterized protein n=1 Tax=Corynebacterium yudongzhengii TaxID=2080740 RepID=A0A2U1T591_9CORY|nr:hypothetical protein [Corynebacterium yudongzhengii]AWB80949.1 hypothetical protein C3B44_00115 [Corynebacterium yudongzhengii]PWC01125.1 hypothetical protein DF222_09130 [Corynebacterium yudongzhengii]